MGLSYTDVVAIIKDQAELITLKARVKELEDSIAAAVDASDTAEAKARAGLPAQP